MARGLPDYVKGVAIEYDGDADVQHGPDEPQTSGTEKSVDNTGAVEVLQGKHKRVGFCVQAKPSNTGIVYLGFDNTVTTTKWFAALQPGAAFSDNSYTGPIHARADVAATQKLGYADW